MAGDRDLFGRSAAPLSRPNDLVRLAAIESSWASTDKAWFLTPDAPGAKGAHVPRSKCARGVGAEINTWSMPRWLAHEKGWL